jgi:hypothetical protein
MKMLQFERSRNRSVLLAARHIPNRINEHAPNQQANDSDGR